MGLVEMIVMSLGVVSIWGKGSQRYWWMEDVSAFGGNARPGDQSPKYNGEGNQKYQPNPAGGGGSYGSKGFGRNDGTFLNGEEVTKQEKDRQPTHGGIDQKEKSSRKNGDQSKFECKIGTIN